MKKQKNKYLAELFNTINYMAGIAKQHKSIDPVIAESIEFFKNAYNGEETKPSVYKKIGNLEGICRVRALEKYFNRQLSGFANWAAGSDEVNRAYLDCIIWASHHEMENYIGTRNKIMSAAHRLISISYFDTPSWDEIRRQSHLYITLAFKEHA